MEGGHEIDMWDDGLFDMVEYEEIPFDEDSLKDADTDRFDIYEDGKIIYGGHLWLATIYMTT